MPKALPPKYLYDDEGSRLFASITDQSDYYPTDCEREIFEHHGGEIASLIGDQPTSLVELGAGDGRKTKLILDELTRINQQVTYLPIDISEAAIDGLIKDLSTRYPELDCQGVAAEYFTGLKWMSTEVPGRKCVMFLGANIGNFSMPQAKVFLRTLWNTLGDGDLLLTGFDLKKSIEVLLRAYNDRAGITSQFNLNLLDRMNRELGANFVIENFEHYGTYNVTLGAMESFLVSLKKQTVYIETLNRHFHFAPYEAIHTEYSFKFLPEELDELMEETGFEVVKKYTDPKGYFIDAMLQVKKA